MMETKYYLHVKAVNVPHYFGCACIKPSKYFPSRSEDIQSKYPSYLLLCTEVCSTEADCSFELILTANEEAMLISNGEGDKVFLMPTPLPISRVSGVYFKDETEKDKITTLTNLSTAFIPKRLAKICNKNDLFIYPELKFNVSPKEVDFSEKIALYNSLMGGFAIMKLAREPYMNYSENYFSTLAFFSKIIEEDLSKNRRIHPIYHDAFVGKDSFKQLTPFFRKEITESDLQSVVSLENQKIKKDMITGIIDLNTLERASYIMGVLYTYGLSDEGRKNKIDGLLLNNFQKDIKQDRAEVVALCYGLNRGYTAFSNKYKSSGNEVTVKFELDSKLDYYTIEILYQYAINEVAKSEDFPYIDKWCPKFEKNGTVKSGDYYILDKLIISEKTQPGSDKWWSKILLLFFQKNQNDLFKPFLKLFYERVKEDIESEYSREINHYKTELAESNEKIQELNLKLKTIENRLSNNAPQEPKTVISKFEQMDGGGASNYKEDLHIAVAFIKKLGEQSKMADAKKMIKEYLSDRNNSKIKFKK